MNAIFYQNRTGCQWAYLPHDLPPKSATYYYFALWRDDGTDQAIHDLLRCQAREKAGRSEDPTAVVLDTQSIRAANHVPTATTGKDAGKRVPGRKRGLAVDALGLIIAVVVTAASVTDNTFGVNLLDKVRAHTPSVTKAWVDAGFKDDVAIHGAVHGIDVEQVKRGDTTAGFVPIARRCGPRTFAMHSAPVPPPATPKASAQSSSASSPVRTWPNPNPACSPSPRQRRPRSPDEQRL